MADQSPLTRKRYEWTRLKRNADVRDGRGCNARPGAATPTRKDRSMATLCRSYTSAQDAHAAVDRLLIAGVAGAEIRVLMGEALHDSRDAAVGTFGGPSSTDAETVGAYAGVGHSGREAMGTFAGDADAQRRGGFSDIDRETVTTYGVGVAHVRIASHHNLEKMLVDAGLDRATAKANVEALHQGGVLVLVQSTRRLEEIAAVIDA
jgi:hypothetical protein